MAIVNMVGEVSTRVIPLIFGGDEGLRAYRTLVLYMTNVMNKTATYQRDVQTIFAAVRINWAGGSVSKALARWQAAHDQWVIEEELFQGGATEDTQLELDLAVAALGTSEQVLANYKHAAEQVWNGAGESAKQTYLDRCDEILGNFQTFLDAAPQPWRSRIESLAA